MTNDPSACFSPSFVTEFEAAISGLPLDHQNVTWANSEKGRVAAVVGPAWRSFLVAVEEGSVWLLEKPGSLKIEVGPVATVTGTMTVRLMRDALDKRGEAA